MKRPLEKCYQAQLLEAGCDEAGRGCLAGPVFAAAVILPQDFGHPLLNDSKQLTAKNRDMLRQVIEQNAVAWSVAQVSPERIDRVNILRASFEAMALAVRGLAVAPELLLIDGNRFRSELTIPYVCIVGGDGLYATIAAASILAKTYRDEYMAALDVQFPYYGWKQNKGYPTRAHRRAIADHGPTEHHRRSFCLLPDPEIDFG